MVVDISKYEFFDFTKFRETVTQHFKDNAELIGLSPNKIVSHKNELTVDGLLIDIYLSDGEVLVDELAADIIEQMNFNIEVILAAEGLATNATTYSKLMERTIKLSLIVDKLDEAIYSEFNNVNITKTTTFRAMFDPTKSLDTIYNGCIVYGNFQSFKR